MSAPKLIEHLDPPENPLSGEDLLMASVRQNGGYVSKKITLETLAEFVNSKESEGGTAFGGYEMYDLSDSFTLMAGAVQLAFGIKSL
jgi:hypothetical protein